MTQQTTAWLVAVGVFGFFAVTLGFIQWRTQSQVVALESAVAAIAQQLASRSPGVTPSTPPESSQQAGQDAQRALTQRVAALETQMASSKSFVSTGTPKSSPVTVIAPSKENKELTIYLGSGSTTNRDWTTIPSTTFSFDLSNYPRLKEVRLEAALSIIGGEAHARIVSADNNNLLFSPELVHNTSTSTWKVSSPLTFATGAKSYVLQLRSTSDESAMLDGARLRLLFQ